MPSAVKQVASERALMPPLSIVFGEPPCFPRRTCVLTAPLAFNSFNIYESELFTKSYFPHRYSLQDFAGHEARWPGLNARHNPYVCDVNDGVFSHCVGVVACMNSLSAYLLEERTASHTWTPKREREKGSLLITVDV